MKILRVDPRDPELEVGPSDDGRATYTVTLSTVPNRVPLAEGGFIFDDGLTRSTTSAGEPVDFNVPACNGPEIAVEWRGAFTYKVVVEKGASRRNHGHGRGRSHDRARTMFQGMLAQSQASPVAVTDLSPAQPLPAPFVTVQQVLDSVSEGIAAQINTPGTAANTAIATQVAGSLGAASAALAAAQQALDIARAGQDPAKFSANASALQAQQGAATFTPPAGLGFPLPLSVTRDALGRYDVPALTVESLHVRKSGPTYYVDPVSGSNTNTGLSWAQAFKDPSYASAKNTQDAAEIVIKGGTYLRNVLPNPRNGSLVLRAAPGERVVFACCDVLASGAWTVSSGTCWQATKASVGGVLDRANVDSDGDPKPLTKAATLAACQSTPHTWFAASGQLYVNHIDGRQPDADTFISMAVATWSIDPAFVTAASSHYVEGIEWWGGTGVNMTTTHAGSKFLAKSSAFKFSATANGLSAWGQSLVVLRDCVASKNWLDGVNYHVNAGIQVAALEINCVMSKNGMVVGSQNGSTSHDASIIVRVGGSYTGNQGANLADVGDAKSWNVGVRASDSKDYRQDFYGGHMWIEHCQSGSASAYVLDGTATSPALRYRDSVMLGTVESSAVTY